MKRIRIGIAGLGAATKTIHLPAYSRLPEVEVVGGADPSGTEDELPFPVFTSTEAMISQVNPDILAVVTPPASHFELTCLGLSAGCHVFCEKPFMTTLDEADEVIAASERAGRWVVVNNQYRFMNIHLAARDRVGQEGFGDLLYANLQQNFCRSKDTESGWRGELTYRTCQEFGTHVFDLCRFFFAEDPSAILARMPKSGSEAGPDYLNLIQLDFSNDRVAQITLNRLCRGPHHYLSIQLDGTEGSVRTELGGGVEFGVGIRGGSRRPYVKWDLSLGGNARLYHGQSFKKIASDPLDIFANATRTLLKAFVDAINSGETPPCHARDNRRTLALMLAAYDSNEAGHKIAIHY